MKREMWLAVVVGAFMIGAPQAVAHELNGVYGAWDLTLETRRGGQGEGSKTLYLAAPEPATFGTLQAIDRTMAHSPTTARHPRGG